MSSSGWQPVTEESPCHVCGKPDWCSVSADDKKAICRRKDDGTGAAGETSRAGLLALRAERAQGPELTGRMPPARGEIPEKADPQTLDQVYGALLDELSLSHAHRQDLHRRGLRKLRIKRGGYRTCHRRVGKIWPTSSSSASGRRSVGGYQDSMRRAGWWSVAGASGMLVPVRDIERRIVALKIRADDAGEGSRSTPI